MRPLLVPSFSPCIETRSPRETQLDLVWKSLAHRAGARRAFHLSAMMDTPLTGSCSAAGPQKAAPSQQPGTIYPQPMGVCGSDVEMVLPRWAEMAPSRDSGGSGGGGNAARGPLLASASGPAPASAPRVWVPMQHTGAGAIAAGDAAQQFPDSTEDTGTATGTGCFKLSGEPIMSTITRCSARDHSLEGAGDAGHSSYIPTLFV